VSTCVSAPYSPLRLPGGESSKIPLPSFERSGGSSEIDCDRSGGGAGIAKEGRGLMFDLQLVEGGPRWSRSLDRCLHGGDMHFGPAFWSILGGLGLGSFSKIK